MSIQIIFTIFFEGITMNTINTQQTNENLTLHFKVKDFKAWRTGYNGNEKSRLSAGITNGRVFHSADDPNDVVVLQDVSDVAKARTLVGLRRPEDGDAKEWRTRLTQHPLRGLSRRRNKA